MNEPIRILHVLTAMNMAGTETLLMNIYRNIDRSKIQFDFAVSAETECDYDEEIKQLGGKIIHYPKYRIYNHFEYTNWWKKFLSHHPEYLIVHGHIGSTAAIYLGLSKKFGRYTIAHSHSTNTQVSLHSIGYKIFSYPTRFIADYYFGCSRQAIIDRFGLKIANNQNISAVLNNAIDSKSFVFNSDVRNSIRREYGIKDDTIVLGTVGRLTKQKNPHEVLNICKELTKRNVSFVFLWFGVGELKEEITRYIKNNSLDSHIKLCGKREDINNVLQAFDIFVFPSLWEGLGIVSVEAQAAGLPTLCSDTIPEEARITDLFEYLPLNNTVCWCDRIEELCSVIQSNEYVRPDTSALIYKANFDIKGVSDYLSSYYLERFNLFN